MKQDRFLMGILGGIALLVVAALAVFFLRQDRQAYLSDATPEGVVHNYILAILRKDYQKAYGYLADQENKPTYDEFRTSFMIGMTNPENAAADVGRSEIQGDTASVEIDMIYTPGDPFSEGYRDAQHALLVNQDGQWKLTSMPTYYFWDYNWYQIPPK
jgi:hypothetical protein